MATNLTEIRNFLNEPYNDLGVNAWIFADLVKTYKNARFMDLGVRLGASSAIMSINADDNNNQVCGCDLKFEGFEAAKNMDSRFSCSWSENKVRKHLEKEKEKTLIEFTSKHLLRTYPGGQRIAGG